MYVLEQAIKREQFPKDVEEQYLDFIKSTLAPRYAEFIGREIQKAYIESYSEYGQNLFDRYIAHADAWIEEQDFKDPDTGQVFDRQVLDAELSKTEKPAGIANPKDFRNEIVKFALRSRAANHGKNPSWTAYEKIREVIEKRMFSQVEDLLADHQLRSKAGLQDREAARRVPRSDEVARLHRASGSPARRVVHAGQQGRVTAAGGDGPVRRSPSKSARQEPRQSPTVSSPHPRRGQARSGQGGRRAHDRRRGQGRGRVDSDRRHRRTAIPSFARHRRASITFCRATRSSSQATASTNRKAAGADRVGRHPIRAAARTRSPSRSARPSSSTSCSRISSCPTSSRRRSRIRPRANFAGRATPTTARRPISPCCARCASA